MIVQSQPNAIIPPAVSMYPERFLAKNAPAHRAVTLLRRSAAAAAAIIVAGLVLSGRSPAEGAPAQPEHVKQSEPYKETEAPLGGNSLLHRSNFAARSFGGAQSLVRKVGGPDPNRCLDSKLPTNFHIDQGGGLHVAFLNMSAAGPAGSDQIVHGKAFYYGTNGPVNGHVEGHLNGTTILMKVTWDKGAGGSYVGDISQSGQLSGQVRGINTGNNHVGQFSGDEKWPCARTQFCSDYASKSTDQAADYQKDNCGPPTDQWGSDFYFHLKWCMGQRSTSPVIPKMIDARKAVLDKCRTKTFAPSHRRIRNKE